MNLAVRILMAVFAAAGAVAWTLLLIGLLWYGHQMAGMGAGAGSRATLSLPELLLVAVVWLVPTVAFVFIFLGAVNFLKGKQHRVGYWYALFFLFVATVALMVLYPGLGVLNLIGLVFMLFTGLWGFAFRKNVPPFANENPQILGE